LSVDLDTLLERCRAGEELAWEALVRRFQSRVYAIAFHYLGDAEEARDLAQEVFVRLYRSLSLCTDAARFVPWLVRVSRNACIDNLRRRRARPPFQDIAVDESHRLRSPGATPEEQWLADSGKRLIYRALRALTELNREVIVLKDIQGLSFEEIASMLNVPVGTVKSRSNRARIELAERVLALSRGGGGGL